MLLLLLVSSNLFIVICSISLLVLLMLFALLTWQAYAALMLMLAKNEQKHVTNALLQAKDLLDTSKQAKQEQLFLQSLIDTLPMQAWVLDTQARYAVLNRQHLQYIGLTQQQVVGQLEPQAAYELSQQAIKQPQRMQTTESDQQQQQFTCVRIPVLNEDQSVMCLVCLRFPEHQSAMIRLLN
jgi:transcriptional regulator with PAS, ATPase and Fis domain